MSYLVANPLSREDPIGELDLTPAVRFRLHHEGILFVGDLADHSELELRDFPRFGERIVAKIAWALKVYGYKLSPHGLEHERPDATTRTCRCHGAYVGR